MPVQEFLFTVDPRTDKNLSSINEQLRSLTSREDPLTLDNFISFDVIGYSGLRSVVIRVTMEVNAFYARTTFPINGAAFSETAAPQAIKLVFNSKVNEGSITDTSIKYNGTSVAASNITLESDGYTLSVDTSGLSYYNALQTHTIELISLKDRKGNGLSKQDVFSYVVGTSGSATSDRGNPEPYTYHDKIGDFKVTSFVIDRYAKIADKITEYLKTNSIDRNSVIAQDILNVNEHTLEVYILYFSDLFPSVIRTFPQEGALVSSDGVPTEAVITFSQPTHINITEANNITLDGVDLSASGTLSDDNRTLRVNVSGKVTDGSHFLKVKNLYNELGRVRPNPPIAIGFTASDIAANTGAGGGGGGVATTGFTGIAMPDGGTQIDGVNNPLITMSGGDTFISVSGVSASEIAINFDETQITFPADHVNTGIFDSGGAVISDGDGTITITGTLDGYVSDVAISGAQIQNTTFAMGTTGTVSITGIAQDVVANLTTDLAVKATGTDVDQNAQDIAANSSNILLRATGSDFEVLTGKFNTFTGDFNTEGITISDGAGAVTITGTANSYVSGVTLTGDNLVANVTILPGGTGNLEVSHQNIPDALEINNNATTVVQDILIDTYGHVTGSNNYVVVPPVIGAGDLNSPGFLRTDGAGAVDEIIATSNYYDSGKVDAISGAISDEIDADISAATGTLYTTTTGYINIVSGHISNEIDSDINIATGNLYTTTTGYINTVSGVLTGKIGISTGELYTTVTGYIDTVSGVLTGKIDSSTSTLYTTVTSYINNVSGVLTGKIDSATSDLYNAVIALDYGTGNDVNVISGSLDEHTTETSIHFTLQNSIDTTNNVATTPNAVYTYVDSVSGDITGYINTVSGDLTGYINLVSGNLTGKIDSATSTLYTTLTSYIDNVSGDITGYINEVSGVLAAGGGSTAFTALTDTPDSIVDATFYYGSGSNLTGLATGANNAQKFLKQGDDGYPEWSSTFGGPSLELIGVDTSNLATGAQLSWDGTKFVTTTGSADLGGVNVQFLSTGGTIEYRRLYASDIFTTGFYGPGAHVFANPLRPISFSENGTEATAGIGEFFDTDNSGQSYYETDYISLGQISITNIEIIAQVDGLDFDTVGSFKTYAVSITGGTPNTSILAESTITWTATQDGFPNAHVIATNYPANYTGLDNPRIHTVFENMDISGALNTAIGFSESNRGLGAIGIEVEYTLDDVIGGGGGIGGPRGSAARTIPTYYQRPLSDIYFDKTATSATTISGDIVLASSKTLILDYSTAAGSVAINKTILVNHVDDEIDTATGALYTTLSNEIDSDITTATGTLYTTTTGHINTVSGVLSAEIDTDVTTATGALYTTITNIGYATGTDLNDNRSDISYVSGLIIGHTGASNPHGITLSTIGGATGSDVDLNTTDISYVSGVLTGHTGAINPHGITASTISAYNKAEIDTISGDINTYINTISGVLSTEINTDITTATGALYTTLNNEKVGTSDFTSHTSDSTIHFTEASIDHTAITNIGSNTHAQIDTHIADATIHFTEGSIDHTAIANIGTNSHANIDTHIADATLHFTEASIDHTNISNIGTNTHAQIDTHIADSTIHFTEGSIDHTAISNVGSNTHAQIDTHISGTANPHATDIGNLGGGTLAELNSAVTDATLDDSSASRPPNGSAGGDLGGTYPNPTVDDGADGTAIHDNVNSEISALTEKATPVSADLIIIEDSAASNAKKKVQIGNLPSGGGGGGSTDLSPVEAFAWFVS